MFVYLPAAGVMPTCSCVMVSGDTVATAGTGLPVLLRKWQRQLPSYTSAYKTDHISEQFYEQLKGSRSLQSPVSDGLIM